MQSRMFALGFGPLPYFRRPGVLLLISPDEGDDDSPENRLLGCVVPHRGGRCQHACSARRPRGDSERCYLCHHHPFVEVLFHNPRSAYDSQDHSCEWSTVPVTPRRAVFRALPVGSKLVMTVGTFARVFDGAFKPMRQRKLVERLQAQLGRDDDEELERRVERSLVRCFLQVSAFSVLAVIESVSASSLPRVKSMPAAGHAGAALRGRLRVRCCLVRQGRRRGR